ncbi:MAG TPA: DUF928 domain-containing protein [Nostocaceae cyanobacterium]|nr:DUF928 domain-containing protein [Nostocaceae cyanobacterium]
MPGRCKQPPTRLNRYRGTCTSENMSVLASVSPKQDLLKIPAELTISDRPTFFAYIPQTLAKEVEFLLRDKDGEVLLREDITLPATNAFIAYTLPESFPGLEVGKKYVWRFSIMCDRNDLSANPWIHSWVKRVQPPTEVTQQLTQAKTNLSRFNIYTSNGYWFDMIKTLHDLRVTSPKTPYLARTWLSVFKSIDLESLAEKPVIEVTGVPVKEKL